MTILIKMSEKVHEGFALVAFIVILNGSCCKKKKKKKKIVNWFFTHEALKSSYALVQTCPCVPDRIAI